MDQELFESRIDINRINFIAVATTPWQLKGIEAAINYLYKKGVQLYGFIVLKEHVYTGRCVNKSMLPEYNGIEVIEAKEWKLGSNCKFLQIYNIFTNRKREQKLYLLNAGSIGIKWISYAKNLTEKQVEYVLLDDGLGGYTGYRGLQKHWLINGTVQAFCKKQLIRSKAFIDFRLMSIDRGTLVVNKQIPLYYQQVFSNDNLLNDRSFLKHFSKKILINTQCLFDNHEIDGDQDICTWRILNRIIKSVGEDVVVKTHPREISLNRYEEFDWYFVKDCQYSQEEILASLDEKPKCIVGITSSSLINSSAIFGIKTISLVYFFLEQDISRGMKRDCEDFIRLCKHLVLMPKTIEELERMILC